MGIDISFMVVSKNKQQMQDLKSYIYELYARDYDYTRNDDYSMNGYEMEIVRFEDYFILTGCHRNCFGWDLGYWCKQENKNDLLTDVFYLEERQDDDCVYLYRADNPNSEEGLLDMTHVIYDSDDDKVDNAADYGFPSTLKDLTLAYLCNRRRYNAMQLEHIE